MTAEFERGELDAQPGGIIGGGLYERDAFDPDEGELDEGELDEQALAELAALAEAEATAAEAEQAAQAEELAAAQRELAAQRAETRSALARYREAVLAAEPELPPELVVGETLEEVEASLAAARRTVAQVRERIDAERASSAGLDRGFPVGAPARGGARGTGMTPAEKIAYGLGQQARGPG